MAVSSSSIPASDKLSKLCSGLLQVLYPIFIIGVYHQLSYAPRDHRQHAHLRVDPSTDYPNVSENGGTRDRSVGARLLFKPFGKDPTEVPAPGVICANKNNGNIRIVQAVADCKRSENHLDLGDLPDLTRIVALEKKVETLGNLETKVEALEILNNKVESCLDYNADLNKCTVGPVIAVTGAGPSQDPFIELSNNDRNSPEKAKIIFSAGEAQMITDEMSLFASRDIKLITGTQKLAFDSITVSSIDGIDINSPTNNVDIRSSAGGINLNTVARTDVPAVNITAFFNPTTKSGGDITIVSSVSGGEAPIFGGDITIDAELGDLKLSAEGAIDTQSGSGCSGTCFDN